MKSSLFLYVTLILGCQSRHITDMLKVREQSSSDAPPPTTIPIQGVMDDHDSKWLNRATTLRMTPKDYQKKKTLIRCMHPGYAGGIHDHTFFLEYITLDAQKLTKAFYAIPAQMGESECHINSAARALVLLGISIDQDYHRFMNVFFNTMMHRYRITTSRFKLGLKSALFLSLLGVCTFRSLSNLEETTSLQTAAYSIMLSGVGIGCVVLIFTGLTNMPAPLASIGSDPWDVAHYINTYLPVAHADASIHCYTIFSICAKHIDKALSIQKRPIIAIFFYEEKSWHYVNIVGVKKGGSDHISEFAILNTNQELYSVAYEDMEYLMYNAYKDATERARWKNPRKNYYIIGFS